MAAAFRFVAAFVIAAAGVAIGVADTGDQAQEFGTVRPASTVADLADTSDLSSRLSQMQHTAVIRDDQLAIWLRYARTMRDLAQDTRDFEARVGRGATTDDGSERGRHALILTAALSDLQDGLTPPQFTRIRPLARTLAGDIICRGLAVP